MRANQPFTTIGIFQFRGWIPKRMRRSGVYWKTIFKDDRLIIRRKCLINNSIGLTLVLYDDSEMTCNS